MAKHCARVPEVRRSPDLRHFAPRGVFFPPHMSPGKMIWILSGLRRKPGRGYPFLDLSPGDGGRRSPVGCLLLSKYLRSAWPRSGFDGGWAAAAAGRRSPVICLLLLEVPAVRLAAKRLRRQEGRCGGGTEVPRSAACFYWKCLLSAWPRSGFGGGGAAAAAGRGSPVSCLLLSEVPAVRLAA